MPDGGVYPLCLNRRRSNPHGSVGLRLNIGNPELSAPGFYRHLAALVVRGNR